MNLDDQAQDLKFLARDDAVRYMRLCAVCTPGLSWQSAVMYGFAGQVCQPED